MVRCSVRLLLITLATGCVPPLDRPPPGDLAAPPPSDLGPEGPAGPAPDQSRELAPAPDQGIPVVDVARPKPEAIPADLDLGRWYAADSKNCPAYCGTLGRANVDSVDGAKCMSGEVRPQSGIDQGIPFVHGCPNNICTPQAAPTGAVSVTKYCYRPGQKQDNDVTDLTVGCYCR